MALPPVYVNVVHRGMSVEKLVLSWYAAADAVGQQRAVERLVALASGRQRSSDWADRGRAASALIELLHLTRHPSDRVSLIRQLGRCTGQYLAVPALHAETLSLYPEVRAAALDSVGHIGLPFGGALVAGWLRDRDPADEPGDVLESALLALARTGHPSVGHEAERLWATGRLRPQVVHIALADAVCPSLMDLARQHVRDPDVAIAASLHLAAVRLPDLDRALSPMLRAPDLTHVHVAERLLATPQFEPEDHLMEVMSRGGGTAELGRAARALRVHEPDKLARGFAALVDEVDPDSIEGRRWVQVAILAGIPKLQRTALLFAEKGEPGILSRALNHLCHASCGVDEMLTRWSNSDHPKLAAASMRARVNLRGADALEDLEPDSQDGSKVARLEFVRAMQNALRNQRDTSGRTRMAHEQRAWTEKRIRSALRSDDPDIQERACFASGNIGLTGVREELLGLLNPECGWKVRRASATALSELPSSSDLEPIVQVFMCESNSEVRFRLIRVMLRALERGDGSSPGVVDAARAGMGDSDAQVAVLAMVLRGLTGDLSAIPALLHAADSEVQSRAVAAITALGRLGSSSATPALIQLSRHEDAARRRRACEALGRVGGVDAALTLVQRVEQETHAEVRAAAVQALTVCPAPPAEAFRLEPNGPEDPLLFELLQARIAALGGGRPLSAEEIDERLQSQIDGFDARRLGKRLSSALRALRTAEFLSGTTELPTGLDASPPVLFWCKGLELWLNDVLAPLTLLLRQAANQAALEVAVSRWDGLKRLVVDQWEDPPERDLWRHMLDLLHKKLTQRSRHALTPREIAAALLCTGPLAGSLGLPTYTCALSSDQRTRLAVLLTQLTWSRNQMAHQRSGTTGEAQQVRTWALEACAYVARLT